jgi:hypothetical protein
VFVYVRLWLNSLSSAALVPRSVRGASHAKGGQEIEIAAQKAPKWTKIVIIPQSELASILINHLK